MTSFVVVLCPSSHRTLYARTRATHESTPARTRVCEKPLTSTVVTSTWTGGYEWVVGDLVAVSAGAVEAVVGVDAQLFAVVEAAVQTLVYVAVI